MHLDPPQLPVQIPSKKKARHHIWELCRHLTWNVLVSENLFKDFFSYIALFHPLMTWKGVALLPSRVTFYIVIFSIPQRDVSGRALLAQSTSKILQQRAFRQNTAPEIPSEFEPFTVPKDNSSEALLKFRVSDYSRNKES